jgi:hypothetical protein
MFEDFRNQMDDPAFQANAPQEEPLIESDQPAGRFLGMTPVQRFIVAVMLLMMVIILGVLFLLVTSKIVPPFMA